VLIGVRNLRKKFGDVDALRGVSFHVAGGEIYGLLGPNGAGKSTTIGILCGLVQPDGGEARLNGEDVLRDPVEARRSLGVVPQEVALYTELSARDNLAFFGRLYGLRGADLRTRIDRVLEQVNLADRAKEPIERYSGGMLRRLNIAAGILHSPKVVLLDEPTVGLDPQSRSDLLKLMLAMRAERSVAVLWATHLCDEVPDADRVVVLHRGKVLANTTPANLVATAGATSIEQAFLSMTGRTVANS
jgi:ABC-2 type transport system ATP-binding protein